MLGAYPERRRPVQGKLERALTRINASLFAKPNKRFHARLQRFPTRVNTYERKLADLNNGQLREFTNYLRAHLTTEGQTEDLTARSFALVREVAGRTLGIRHFNEQLIGGWVIAQGMLAEMETGEGKTLTATLPACTAALSGVPVHIISVNDYLVTRDAELMQPIYNALGLSVGAVTQDMDINQRRAAYACDITYCSNKQVAFDYLRDQLARGTATSRLRMQMDKLTKDVRTSNPLLLRGLSFAIIDEADSVLIDEGRTPLILSRPGDATEQEDLYQQALTLARKLDKGTDFLLNPAARDISMTPQGKTRLSELAEPLGGAWAGSRAREELVTQALCAQHLFLRDKHYLVREGKIQIIDEYTGRVMPDRSWERGLHQLIEIKEGCEMTPPNETLIRTTYQHFFRRYLQLSGMSGTVHEVATELKSVYDLDVVSVVTHRPVQRHAGGTHIFLTAEEKWKAVTARVRKLQHRNQPVLVGTRTVADSENLSRRLAKAGLPHQVLNARQDQQEAQIIGLAGQPGQITIATNIAGRGTDIQLANSVVKRGGLVVIVTERNEARRIDRQLIGRCGRQGDPGSYECLLSLEDELLRKYLPAPLNWLLRTMARSLNNPLFNRIGNILYSLAQHKAEQKHARTRKALLKADDKWRQMLAFTGDQE